MMIGELWQRYRFPIVCGCVVLIIVFIGIWRLNAINEQHRQAVQLTEQQMRDIDALQKELTLSKQNAAAVKAYYDKAMDNQFVPVNHFYISAPSAEEAATLVNGEINANNSKVISEAMLQTDRTLVVAQPSNQQYQVGVYKINTYRNWEWSIGIGVHSGNVYMPIGLQRNYSKDAAVATEVHFGPGGVVNGGAVKYIRKTDKLFFLF